MTYVSNQNNSQITKTNKKHMKNKKIETEIYMQNKYLLSETVIFSDKFLLANDKLLRRCICVDNGLFGNIVIPAKTSSLDIRHEYFCMIFS